jgi:hypothetical protein
VGEDRIVVRETDELDLDPVVVYRALPHIRD